MRHAPMDILVFEENWLDYQALMNNYYFLLNTIVVSNDCSQ